MFGKMILVTLNDLFEFKLTTCCYVGSDIRNIVLIIVIFILLIIKRLVARNMTINEI